MGSLKTRFPSLEQNPLLLILPLSPSASPVAEDTSDSFVFPHAEQFLQNLSKAPARTCSPESFPCGLRARSLPLGALPWHTPPAPDGLQEKEGRPCRQESLLCVSHLHSPLRWRVKPGIHGDKCWQLRQAGGSTQVSPGRGRSREEQA